MENYYEILALNPQSSSDQIMDAINIHYNQIRRLTTHHDPNVVNQANQALLILEKMKTTLLDPTKRAEYDLALYNVSGLADPTALLANAPGNVNGVIGNTVNAFSTGKGNFTEGWICTNCQRSNPMGVMFCQYCSATIGRICPNCQTHYETKVAFCPTCGKNYEQAQRKNTLSQELQQKQIQVINFSHRTFENTFFDARYFSYLSVGSFGWAILMAAISILFTLAILFKILLSFFNDHIVNSSFVISLVKFFSGVNSILMFFIWASVLGIFYYLIKKKGMKIDLPVLIGYGLLSLFALLFQGRSLYKQIYMGSKSGWLIFLAIIAAIMIGLGGFLFSRNQEEIGAPEINKPAYKKVESYVRRIFAFYRESIWVVSGIGVILSLLVAILSPSNLLLGVIAGIVSFAVSFHLLVISYRSYKIIEKKKSDFVNLRKSEENEENRLKYEISEIQKQISEIG